MSRDSSPEKLKILIVNYEHPPVGGGGGVCTRRLAKALVKKGHHVDILTTWFKGLKKEEVEDGYTIYRIPVIGRKELKTASNVSMLTFPITSIPKGIQLCAKNKYDVINTHFYAPSGPTGLVLSLLFGIPNVLYLHGADVYDPTRLNKTPAGKGLLSLFLRTSAKIQNIFATKLACQSSDTKKNILAYIKPKKEITIIPLPYESPPHENVTKEDMGLDPNKFHILSAGRAVKRKGYKYLVKALAHLDNSIEVNIICSGPEIPSLKKLANKLRVADRIKFRGEDRYIDDDEKFRYFAVSDLYVLSSLHEGMGIVLQEAMDFGLPIVSTNKGGQVDILKDGRNAILVDPKNVDQLVKAIDKLFKNKELREKLGENNLEDVKMYYSDKIADRFITLFKEAGTLHEK